MAASEPPATFTIRRGGVSQSFFRDVPRKSRNQRVQRDDFSRPIRQRKKFRIARTPHLFGSILNYSHLIVRHHGLQLGTRGQQFGGALQLYLPLRVQVLEGQYGIARILLDDSAHLFFSGVAHDGQSGERERGNQQGKRQEEFCAQARLG